MADDDLVLMTLVCHTAGCRNADVAVELFCPPDSLKVCGPCGQTIEDVS